MADSIAIENEVHAHDHHAHEHHHDHHETFLTKYIFSQDHKMIAKQFLVTSIFMAVVAFFMSLFFRLQLAWPDQPFMILDIFLGKWAKEGILDPNFYLSLITMHGTLMVFFVLTAGLTGTYANLLIPYQLGVRDMVNPFMNMLSFWFFAVSSLIMIISLFVESGPAARRRAQHGNRVQTARHLLGSHAACRGPFDRTGSGTGLCRTSVTAPRLLARTARGDPYGQRCAHRTVESGRFAV